MVQAFGRTVAPLFVLTVMGALAPARGDTVLYSTSFESPAFTTGAIAGQNGWASFAASTQTVENSFAKTGSQAVFVSGGATSQSGPYYASASNGPLIDLSADIALFSSSTQTEWQFAALGPGFGGFLGGIDIVPDNTIYAITAGLPAIGTFTKATAFSSAAWVNVNLLFDIAAQTYSISLDGVTLDSNIPFCGDNVACTSGTHLATYGAGLFDSFGRGNDSGYMDNYSVTLVSGVPEPSYTIPLLSVLLVGAGLKLRRRFSASARTASSSA